MTELNKSLDEMAKECHPREWDSVTSTAAESGFKSGYSQGYLAAVEDLKEVSEEMAPKFTEQDGVMTLEVVSPEHMADWLRERIREKGILE